MTLFRRRPHSNPELDAANATIAELTCRLRLAHDTIAKQAKARRQVQRRCDEQAEMIANLRAQLIAGGVPEARR